MLYQEIIKEIEKIFYGRDEKNSMPSIAFLGQLFGFCRIKNFN